ncbi:hypothetical protein QE152_g1407, partial [Popillia japonica]
SFLIHLEINMPPQSQSNSSADVSNEVQETQVKRADQPLNYVNIFFITLGHVAFVYYFVTFPWIQKYYLVLYTAANMHFTGLGVTAGAMHFTGLGVTAGAHRYFTHRSYKAKLPLKILLLIAYASCGHNKLYDWVRDHRTHHKYVETDADPHNSDRGFFFHRTHHKYVETDADPHNSDRGFFFSHVGWLFMKKHPEVIAKGNTVNMSDISSDVNMSDISSDPILVWYDNCIISQRLLRYIILLNINASSGISSSSISRGVLIVSPTCTGINHITIAANMHFTGLGVTVGAHRYFTHRSYKVKLPLKILLLIAYASCGHNKLYDWVRDNTVNMSDISSDPILVWYDKHYILMKTIFCFIIPTIIPYYLFNEDLFSCIISQCLLRYIILLNITWSVNSFAHMYGNKPYNKHQNSKENIIVSIATIGEGWHNYHHAFPWDYRASEHGKLNFTTAWLDLCGRLGWAYDFRAATESMIRKVVEQTGDGRYLR